MLTNLFSKKAENLSPAELLARVEERLHAYGYEEDKDTNHQIRASMLEEAQNLGIEILNEDQICPVKLAYIKTQSNDDLIEEVVISRANPGKGIQLSDKIELITIGSPHHQAHKALFDGLLKARKITESPLPRIQTQTTLLETVVELSLEDFLSLPQPAPIKSAAKNLIAKVADRVMSYF